MVSVALDPSTASPEQCRCWQELDDQAERRKHFVQFEQALCQQFERQEISLGEWVDRLFYYSLNHYPEHLEHVAMAERGATIKVKLAENLLRGFRVSEAVTNGQAYAPIIARVEGELLVLADLEAGGTGPKAQ